MSSVDNRIVNMQFNNGQFEAGVSQSIGSLNKLKDSLQLKDAATGLSNLGKAVGNVNLSPIASAVSSLQNRFSTMGVAGMAAIQNLTNRAVNAGVKLVKSFTVDPILDGFNELETKNKAITTIMANVGEHNTIDDVSRALDELNTYADKTIYSFSDMTQNIGRFTAAGVDLTTSVQGIKGMSNLAAFFGADNTQAQRAMYQISQALATGTIRLMDWNSMVQASMGGTAMSDLLVDVARKQGKGVDAAIEKYGSFRESLREGWLDNDVFMEALGYFAAEIDDTNAAMKKQEYVAAGWSEEMADHLVYLGKTATESATKVRSYRQMMDTMHEETGSAWSSTFDMILGGYNGTTQFWDDIYQAVSPITGIIDNIRNAGIKSWVNMGGQQSLMDTMRQWLGSDKNSTRGIKNEALAIGEAFESVFGVSDAVQKWTSGKPEDRAAIGSTHLGQLLMRFTNGLGDFVRGTQLTENGISNLGDTWEGVVSAFDIGFQTVGTVVNLGSQLATAFAPVQEIFLALTAPIGRVARSFRDWFLSFDPFMKLSKGFKTITTPIHDGLQWIADGLTNGFDMMKLEDITRGTLDFFSNLGAGIIGFFTGGAAIPLGETIGNWLTTAGGAILSIGQSPMFKNLGQSLVDGYHQALDFAKPYFENATSLQDYLSGFGNMATDAFTMVSDSAEKYLPIAGKAFGSFVKGFKKNVKIDALTLGSFLDGHKRLIEAGWTGPMDMTGSLLMDSIISVSDFMQKIGKRTGINIPDIFGNMVESAHNAVETIKGYFSGAQDFSGYFEGAKNMASDMVSYVKERFSSLSQDLPGIWDNFKEKFGAAKDYVADHAKDIPDATKTMASRVKDTMANLVERFQSSSVGTSLAGAFESIQQKVLDVIKFFSDHRTDIWEAIQSFAHSISEGIKNFLPGVIDWIDDFVSRIVEKFSNAADNGIFDRIGSALSNAGSSIGEGFQSFFTSFGTAFQGMGDFFKNNSGAQMLMDIPWTDIALIGQTIAMIGVLKTSKGLITTLDTTAKDIGKMVKDWGNEKKGPLGWGAKIADSITGFIGEWGKVGTSISGAITKTSKWAGVSMFLKALTPVLAAVAGLSGIAMVDKDAVITATACVGALGGLFAAVAHFGASGGGDGKFNPSNILNIGEMAFGLAAIAGSVLVLSSAVKKLGILNAEEIQQGMTNVGILMGAMTGMMALMNSQHFGVGGKIGAGKDVFLELAGIAGSVWLLSGTISKLGTMDVGQLVQGLIAMGAILGEIGTMMGVTSKISGGKGFTSNFGTIIGFAASAVLLANSLRTLADMSWEDIGKGLAGMGGAMAEISIAMAAIAHFGNSEGTGSVNIKGFAGMGVAILSIAGAFKMMQGIDMGSILTSLTGIGTVLGALTGVSAIISHFELGGALDHLTNSLIKLGAATALFGAGFAGIAAFITMLNDLKTAVSGTGLGESIAELLNGFIDGFAAVQGKLMAFLMGVFVSFIDSVAQYMPQLISGIANVIVAAFEGLSTVTPQIVSAIHGFCQTLFGEVQNQFGDLDWAQFGEMFESLVITPMMTAIVGKLVNVKMGDIAKMAAAVLLTVGPLVAATVLLSQAGNQTGVDALAGINNIIQTVSGVTIIMGLLSKAGLGVGNMVKGGLGLGLGIDALIGSVGALAAGIGAFPELVGAIDSGTQAMQQIVDIIGQFDGSFVALSAALGLLGGEGIGIMAAGGASIGAAIDAVVAVVGALSAVFGGIDALFGGGFNDILDRGTESFTKIGEAIGGFIGGMTGNAMAANAERMPDACRSLQEAFSAMKPMMDDLNEMGDPGVNRIQTFVDTVKSLSELDPLLADFKTGALKTFAEGMPDVGTGMKGFADSLEGANLDNLDKGMEAMQKMVGFAKDLPDAPDWNLGQWFVGRKQTLTEFANGLKEFYPVMQEVIGAFGNENDLDTTGLVEAIEAAQKISDLQNSLQGFKGASVVSFFAGQQQDLIDFAQGIGAWTTQLKGALDTFGNENDLDVTGLDKAIQVAGRINELALKLPEEASLKSALFGGLPKSLTTFATEIGDMASVMGDIDWSFDNMDPQNGFDQAKFSTVISTISQLAEAAGKMPSYSGGNVLGLVKWFDDPVTLGELGQNLNNHMDDFNALFSGLDGIDVKEGSAEKLKTITGVLNDLATAQGNLDLHEVNVQGGLGSDGYSYTDKITTLGEFVSGLTTGNFLDNLKSFIGKLQQFTPEGDLSNLKNVTGMLTDLVTAYNDLPPELDNLQPNENGDYSGKFTAMGSQLGQLAIGLASLSSVGFDSRAGTFNQTKLDAITQTVESVKTLSEAYANIASGDLTPGVSSAQSWTNFATSLTDLGKGLQTIAQVADGINPDDGSKIENFDLNKIDTVVEKTKALAELVGDNGALKGFKSTDFSEFNDALSNQLGPGLKGFYNAISDFDGDPGNGAQPIETAKISDMIGSVQQLAGLTGEGGALKDFKADGFDELTKALNTDLGTSLRSFYDGLFGEGSFNYNGTQLENAMAGIPEIANTFNDLPNLSGETTAKVTALSDCLSTFMGAFFGSGSGTGAGALFQNRFMPGGGMGTGTNNTDQMLAVIGQLSTLATGISEISAAFASVGDIDMSAVSNFTTQLGELMSIFGGGAGGAQGGLAGQMGMFGGMGTQMGSDMGGVSSVVTNVQAFAAAMQQLSGALASIGGTGLEGGGDMGGSVLTQLSDLMTQIQSFDFSGFAASIQQISTALSMLGGGGPIGPTLSGAPMGGGVGAAGAIQQLTQLVTTLQSVDLAGAAASIQQMSDALNSLSAGGDMGGGALTGIQEMLTQLSSFDWSSLTTGITDFTTQLSQLGDAASSAMESLVSSCTSALQQVVQVFQQAGQQASQQFANGISSGTGMAVAAASSMAQAAAAATHVGGWSQAGMEAAQGYAAGIAAGTSLAVNAAAAMAAAAVSAAKNAQASGSPSRKFMELGNWAAQGYMIGMDQEQEHVNRTTANVITTAIARAYSLAQTDMNLQPVIEPVLDMSSIGKDAEQVNNLFATTRTHSLARAVGTAAAISARMRENAEIQNGAVEPASSSVTNNFTQNITSPKAVSRFDIYRDTKNLFALEKGAASREKMGAYVR